MIAKGSGYVRGAGARGRLGAHLKYIEHRAKSERETRDDLRILDAEHDVVNRGDVVQDIMDHEHRGVAYHKSVLSPGQDEPVEDWREWTRDVMSDLQERQGKQLHWYAVHHDNTDNPTFMWCWPGPARTWRQASRSRSGCTPMIIPSCARVVMTRAVMSTSAR